MSNLLLFPMGEPPRPFQPLDAAVRAEALDVRRSFIVQAPAGSGKTALLIQRFLKLLADDSVTQPEQVLAITFTNAATAELRDRVLEKLEDARAEFAEQHSTPLALAAGRSQETGSGADYRDFKRLTLDLAHDVLARDAALGWQLLDRPQRLKIRTFDSVCKEIAESLPVLSASGGRLRPTEEATLLHREAARRTLLLLGGDDAAFDHALRDLLLHRDGNLEDCESLLADMLALRDQWGELVPLDRRELDDAWLDANLLPSLERTLEDAITSTLVRLDALFPADLLCNLASLAGHLGHLPSTTDDPSPVACCAGMQEPPGAAAIHLERWLALIHLLVTASGGWRRGFAANHLKFALAKNHPCRAQLERIVDQFRGRDDLLAAFAEVRELPDPRYPANQWAVAKSLFRVLSRALVELQLVFAERGQCDFTELSLLARSALRDGSGPGDLASALGSSLQHLLVDEMQDTSTGQYELLELLTASWDGHSQTVFLVGDPFQSIYLFRQARVERFLQALETGQLGDTPLTQLALTSNFRSQRTLVDQFNEDFESIFGRPRNDDSHAPSFLRAEATEPNSSIATGRTWHANPQPPRVASTPAGPVAALALTQAHRDAESIAAIAAGWLAQPVPSGRHEPWRMAVLVRSRNHLIEIVPALRRAGIPFRAVDIETLHDRQEVLDLAALARALLHPADRVAALAVLRAPWCGLPLADLHTLTGADDFNLSQYSVLRLIEERAHLLPAESRQRLARVQEILRAAAPIRSRLTASQLVERAWRSLGGDAPLTPPQLTNARRFFELLDTLETSTGRVDTTQLEDRLEQLYAEPDPVPASSGYVELLTIHKAKGLEWDVVFLPALERRPASSPVRLLTWAVLDNLEDASAVHIMLAPIAARGEEVDPLTRWLKRRHRDREYAENRRLFYVACTRARLELHLFAAPAITANGVSPGPADSLLNGAWPAAESHFTGASPQSPTAGSTEDGGEDKNPEIIDIRGESQAFDANPIPAQYPVICRLPAAFDPSVRLADAQANHLPYGVPSTAFEHGQLGQFVRPEGSFAARSFGNAVHACIELLTSRIASGVSVPSLLAELPSWSARIMALLRADGLLQTTVTRLARDVRAGLENLLRDPDGRWLLEARQNAAAEFSLTAVSGEQLSTVRADRIFRAGPEPHLPGDTHLWIVDYKTASRSAAQIKDFLNEQRAAYARQLETYAHILAPAQSIPLENVRLALYFPALANMPRLIWWPLMPASAMELRTEN